MFQKFAQEIGGTHSHPDQLPLQLLCPSPSPRPTSNTLDVCAQAFNPVGASAGPEGSWVSCPQHSLDKGQPPDFRLTWKRVEQAKLGVTLGEYGNLASREPPPSLRRDQWS